MPHSEYKWMEKRMAELKSQNTALRAEVERLRGFEAANRLNAAQVAAQRAENEKLRKMLWEVNEQCPEHVPVYLLEEIRAALGEKQ